MALIAEIAAFLATAGLGTVGTTIFRYELPETPAACIAVVDLPVSDASIFTFGAAGSLPAADQPRFDVVVRDTDRATAWRTARKVRNALNEQSGSLTNPDYNGSDPDGSSSTTRYHLIRVISEPYEREAYKPATYEVGIRFSAMKERS